MLGPYISASSNPILRSSELNAVARFTENVDLPTPPLPLAIATIFFASILNLLLSLLFVITVISYGSSFLIVPIADKYLSDGLGLNVYPVFSIVNFIKIFFNKGVNLPRA